MSQTLTLNDIDSAVQSKVTKQSHNKPVIDGVKIIDLKNFMAEDGSFTELLRFSQDGIAGFPDFSVAQINRSVMLAHTVKAWHLHFNQDEVWNVGPTTHLILGLWDVREHSATKGTSLRIPITHSRLVYIPRGVCHGAANHSSHHAEVIYFVSNQYNPENPDEQRLPWDSLGKEFWDIKRE